MSEPADIRIRSFEPRDQSSCRRLYVYGLVGGKLADNDSGVDIDDIQSAYMRSPDDHFWVAENDDGQIIGMIGVQHHEKSCGAVRRLRVAIDHRRRGIGSALVEAALDFCQRRHHVKVTLDTFLDHEPAVRLFQKFNFRHDRTRDIGGKQLMYFYLDLYCNDERNKRQK